MSCFGGGGGGEGGGNGRSSSFSLSGKGWIGGSPFEHDPPTPVYGFLWSFLWSFREGGKHEDNGAGLGAEHVPPIPTWMRISANTGELPPRDQRKEGWLLKREFSSPSRPRSEKEEREERREKASNRNSPR